MKNVFLFYVAMLFTTSLGLLACGGDDSDDVAKEDSKSSQSGKLVRRIEVYKGRDKSMNKRQVIQLIYGDDNRVIAADYWGVENVCGPVGARVHYIVSGNVLSLMFSQPASDKNLQQGYNGEGFGQGILNSMGLLEEDYIDATAYNIESGKYLYLTYEHNEKGQITKLVVHHTMDSYEDKISYTWKNDCLIGASGSLYPSMPSKINYTNYENKTNIDLNWLIYDQMFSEDIFGYTLCGYITTKSKYLTSAAEWTFDAEGYPISGNDGKRYYDISY